VSPRRASSTTARARATGRGSSLAPRVVPLLPPAVSAGRSRSTCSTTAATSTSTPTPRSTTTPARSTRSSRPPTWKYRDARSDLDPIAAGAFLSGVASVLTASWYVRKARKRAIEECDKRLADFERALHEGIEIERGRDSQDRPAG